VNWEKFQKNILVLWFDRVAEGTSANSNFVDENCEPLLCRLEDGVIFVSANQC